jgi:hypothetical protein
MADSAILLRGAYLAGTLTLASLMLAQAGNPWDSEPTEIPEEQYEIAEPEGRNPKNRFGMHGGVAFGVKAKFISAAFSGDNIVADPDVGPESVTTDRTNGSDDERGALSGEIFYERILGESNILSEGVNEFWGIHIGVGFNEFGFKDTVGVDVFGQDDGGFISTGSINNELDADMWRIDVGLFKESYLTDRLYAKFGGGLSAAYIEADYSLSGPFNFADLNDDDSDFVFGGYVDLTVGYDFTRNWSLYGGVRYQYLTDFEVGSGGAEAKIEFDQAYMAFLGVRFAF